MTNCEYLPLTKVLSFIVDNRGKTVPTTEEGIPLIATNCIKNNELYPIFEKVRYLSQDTYDNWFRAHPIPGDIIFVNKGTPGRVCLVPNPVRFCIAQDMMAFRVNDKIISNKYLFAVLRSQQFQTQIEQFHVGTLIPHFKKGDLDKLLIPIPSRNVQNYIGETYYTLCNKIELNNRINKTLEEMAQAIFKSWFVDFEPFQDGEFEDSELGRIPKGWRIATIDEYVIDMKNGGTPSRKKDNYWNSNDIPWIKTGEIKNSLIIKSEEYISYEGLKNSSAKILPYNSVLMAMYGATAGQIGLLKFEACTNQACCAMICNSANKAIFLYLHLLNNQSYIEGLAVGAAQQNLSKDTISKLKLIIPDDEVIESAQFNEIFNCIEHNLKENQVLTTIRDTLLPKIMSGEIRVPIEEV